MEVELIQTLAEQIEAQCLIQLLLLLLLHPLGMRRREGLIESVRL